MTAETLQPMQMELAPPPPQQVTSAMLQESIAAVTERKDSIDARRAFGKVPVSCYPIATGAGTFTAFLEGAHNNVATFLIGASLVTAANYAVREKLQERRLSVARRNEIGLNMLLQQPADVIRTKDGPDAIRWYGFDAGYHKADFDPLLGVGEYRKITRAAQDTKASLVTVSANILSALPDNTDTRDFGIIREGRTYIGDKKKLPIQDLLADKSVLESTPEQAEKLANALSMYNRRDGLEAMMSHIASKQPGSKLPAMYGKFMKGEIPITKLREAAREQIQEHLGGQTEIFEERRHDGVYARSKTQTSAMVRNNSVLSWNVGTSVDGREIADVKDMTSVLRAFGAASLPELLVKGVQSPSTEKSEAAIYLLCGLSKELRDKMTVLSKDESSKSDAPIVPSLKHRMYHEAPERAYTTYGVRRFSSDRVGRLRRRNPNRTVEYKRRAPLVRYISGLALTAALVAGSGVAASHIDDATKHRYEQAEATYKQSVKSPAHIGDSAAWKASSYDSFKEYYHDQNDPLDLGVKAVRAVQSADKKIYKATGMEGGGDAQSSIEGDSDGGNGDTRNANFSRLLANSGAGFGEVKADDSDKNETDEASVVGWKLQPFGGATTEGYWTDVVHSHLGIQEANPEDALPPYSDKNMDPYQPYSPLTKERNPHGITFLPEHHDQADAGIRVSGVVAVTDALIYNGERRPVLRVPVLNGSSIESATFGNGGEFKVRPAITASGEQLLMLPQYVSPGMQNDLTYTVVPGKSTALPRAHKTMTVTSVVKGDIVTRPIHDTLSRAQANSIWQAMPGEQPAEVPKDPLQVANEIMTTHTYSLTPYSDAHVKSRPSAPHETTPNILTNFGKTAAHTPSTICNLDTMQEILMTRGVDAAARPLNIATGYHQQEEDDLLGTDEAHMWAVDHRGSILDAAPFGGGQDALKASNEGPSKKDIVHIAEAGAGAIALGGLAWFAYPRARRKYRLHRKGRALRELGDSPAQLSRNQEYADYAKWLQYGRPDDTEKGTPSDRVQNPSRPDLEAGVEQHLREIPYYNRRELGRILRNKKVDQNDPFIRDFKNFMRRVGWVQTSQTE
jgi:hypothetical protein